MQLQFGLIREEKNPADNRVVLTPQQCAHIQSTYKDVRIIVQPSSIRAFPDEEYLRAGIPVQEDLSACDILLGVKEVPVDSLLQGKTYCMFSHTIKKQPYNRDLLKEVLRKDITLVDYECITNSSGGRLIAFGRWAGIVGGHNALWSWQKRVGLDGLKRARDMKDFEELKMNYQNFSAGPVRIGVSGSGRVANGVLEVMDIAGIKRVSPSEILTGKFDEAVYAQLDCPDLYKRKDGKKFDFGDFFAHPDRYESTFAPFTHSLDIFINAIYWDPNAPAFFSREEMKDAHFRIKLIADITCDIAPDSSIPSTVRPSTIDVPVYGFNPVSWEESEPFKDEYIDVMAVDNLPNELARDASESFGEQFMQYVLREFYKKDSDILHRATIATDGQLTPRFSYLSDYAGLKIQSR